MISNINPKIFSIGTSNPKFKINVDNFLSEKEIKEKVNQLLPKVAFRPYFLTKRLFKKFLGVDSLYLHFDLLEKIRASSKQQIHFFENVGNAALEISYSSAQIAINNWGGNPKNLTHFIYISSSDMEDFSIDLIPMLGLRDDIERFPIFYQTCHSGLSGLRLADKLARINPKNRVLLVSTDMPNKNFNNFSTITSFGMTLAFGDGSASLVIGMRESDIECKPLFEVLSVSTKIVPDTYKDLEMTYTDNNINIVHTRNLPIHLSSNVPGFGRQIIENSNLASLDLSLSNYQLIFHSGKKSIIQANAKATNSKLEATKRVFKKYGNMTGPTVYFVLNESRNLKWKSEYGIMNSFGFGLVLEGALIKNLNIKTDKVMKK
ncbi:hypothetical protein DLAC_00742 [Tieghemostelium lacteum]|uniref:Polyketide synthase n=1 Tax=Tieghemostelium lacteum TaxID=361077 RepID=A0A152A6T0_TIELA|nr:hypothetical protein DLAC_00742 [Tieghemostelium lacteum]|eukprot:KYR01952.1 hypothetical protein DLAC_00742 [Tieghemostelium lacteum]